MTTSPSALLGALRAAVGDTHVLTVAPDVEPFVVDFRKRFRGEALAVVLPAGTDEVSAVVRACAQAGVPLLPQGGHTGLVASATPVGTRVAEGNAPVVISLRRMNRIRAIDPVGNTLVADAGCVVETIQQAADAHGRMYPVTWGAQGSAHIGGAVSTNAGGTGVLKYGNTREQVLGLEVVLPDGRIWDGLRTLRKDNAGYALKHLFIGGEGTLGVITAVALRLLPKPAVSACAWLTIDTVDAGLQCLAEMQTMVGDRIAAWELLNRAQMHAVRDHQPGTRLPTDPDAPYAILVELTDTWARTDLDALLQEGLGRLAERGLIRDAAIAASEAQRNAFWKIRHGIADSNLKAGVGFGADVAVPVAALARFIDNAGRAVHARFPQVEIVLVAHMGDGNVHYIPRFSFDDWARVDDKAGAAEALRALVHDEAVALGGTFSAEHGIGHVLPGELARLRSPLELELMRKVRAAFDPQGMMNPGKVLR